jgi:MarR family transcriptional regulator, organic hydroperoxide resistance regulator
VDIVLSLQRATHHVGQALGRDPALDFSQAEAHVLALLVPTGALRTVDLLRGLAHKPSTLTSILDRLESRSLVARRSDPDDRRSFVVELSPEGRDAAARVVAAIATLEGAVRARVTSRDLDGYRAVLRAVEETR